MIPPWLLRSMRQNASLTCPLRVARHFVERLHERFPDITLTEGQLQQELARAEWYPSAGPDRSYYAVCRLRGRLVTLVVALQQGLADLITVYEPKSGWDRRISNLAPWPFSVVAALST